MPSSIFSVIPLIMLVGVGTFLSYFYFGGKKLHSNEIGIKPLLVEQCGARIDGFNLTAPLVRHAIYDTFIVIAYGRTKYVIEIKELSEIKSERHLFSTGLRYIKKTKRPPFELIVWSDSLTKAAIILQSKDVKYSL